MLEDRELVIKIKHVYHEEELSHWLATMELDGEQIYEETGIDLRDVGDRIYSHIWKEGTTVPPAWRDAGLPWPKELTYPDINGDSPDDWK